MQGSTRMDQIEKIFSHSRLTFFIFSTQPLPWSKDTFELCTRQMDVLAGKYINAKPAHLLGDSVQGLPWRFVHNLGILHGTHLI